MTITTQSFVAVNVGTAANDGTGDELRSAFIKLNSNFSNISTSGFNAGNILASGNVQAVYFVGDGSQLTNISAANAYGNGNVASYLTVYNGIVSATNVSVAGNVTAQWLVGQANLSTVITQNLGSTGIIYANAGTASTSTGTGALVVNGGLGVTGNITCGNLTVLGNITSVSTTTLTVSNNFVFLSNNNITNTLDIGFVGQYAAGQGNVYTGLAYRAADGIYRLFSNLNPVPSSTINMANVTPASLALGNILAANIIGTVITPSQAYITSVGNLANVRSSGNITTTGYFFGNGSQLAGLVSYSNVYVATYLPTYSGSVGSITASNIAGATITAIYSNIAVSNSSVKNYVDGQISAANSAVTAANLGMIGYVNSSVSSVSNAATYTGNIVSTVNGFSIGYLDVPQNSRGANDYVLTASDRGKHILSTGTVVANIFIPTNSGVSWNVGASIIIVNNGTGNANIIANSGVTLYLAGSSTTGANARILGAHGMATLLNTTANVWYISGTGVS